MRNTTDQNHQTRVLFEGIIVGLILLFCEWFFFRHVLGAGSDFLISDRADGRLTNLLTEHWWHVFCGKERFSEIAIFFPHETAFGYTDLFLGYGIIFSLFRLLGLNMFLSFKWTLILIHVFGTLSMFYLLKKRLHCGTLWSLFGTVAFCFSDTFARFLIHPQLDALSFLPLLLVFGIGFVENQGDRKKRRLYACAFLFWFAMITYTSWYVACFTGIFLLILLITFLLVLRFRRVSLPVSFREMAAQAWKEFLAYLLFAVLLFIPFLKIYIPVLRESSGYSYRTCVDYLPEMIDIINVTEGNWMLGKLIRFLRLSSRGYSFEVNEGFSIILLALFLLTMILVFRKRALSVAEGEENAECKQGFLCSVYLAIVITLMCVVRLSANGVSLWAFIYYLIPVARSVRAVARFLLWLSFPMAVAVSWVSDRTFSKRNLLIPICAVVLLFLSNINLSGVAHYWTESKELAFIDAVAPPPTEAEVFYITDSAKTGDPDYMYQVDAFEIADHFSLKTINGYSGQMPPGWDGIWGVCSDWYEASVSDWVNEHDLKNVYAYDRAENIWLPYEREQKDIGD